MESLESLNAQIESCRDLHSVVKTMKTLAAVNIRQYEKGVESLNDYRQVVEMGLQIVLRHPQDRLRPSFSDSQQPQRIGLIVLGSDQGLCGSFNEQVIQLVCDYGADRHLTESPLAVMGWRATQQLKTQGLAPEHSFATPGSAAGITTLVQNLLLMIDTWRDQHRADLIWLFYNHPLSSSNYHPTQQQVFPLDPKELRELSQRPWPGRQIPTYTLSPSRLLAALIQQALFLSLYQACMGSLASENAARLLTLQNAERNIEERIDSLTTAFHQQRQTQITEELLDVVAGFEALTSEQDKT